MSARHYPAVLAVMGKASRRTFAVWLPDFPDCVAAGATQEDAIAKAEERLRQGVETLAERDIALPAPTPIAGIERPKDFVAFVMLKVEPPNPSERVNVYLPKALIGRADHRAAELGMSRSSFFGLALNMALYGNIGRSVATALAGAAARSGEKRKR
jgi:predicted RNase H-like HicB family nuclease